VSSTRLQASTTPLARAFDVALLDLDGVVYIGRRAVPDAAAHLAAARAQGMRLAFVTNNAARPPEAVAERLRAMSIPAEPAEVITSAQAAAHYLAERITAGAAVLVVGTDGLYQALTERGLRPVSSADDDPAAVVQGYSPTLTWAQLAEGAVAIRRGLPWIATNADRTVPSERGPLPGNGSMVAALRHATGATPTVTGKPDPTMHRESVQRSGARHPLVVGDRLDTDIAGAAAVGCPSLLVLTGVTTPAELLAAPPGMRPSFVAPDLSGLLRRHPAPTLAEGAVMETRLGGWAAAAGSAGRLVLRRARVVSASAGDGPASAGEPAGDDGLDPLRALCAISWRRGDAGERARCVAGDEAAGKALASLDLG